ncbi:hypothetical protein [Reyranella sp.]|uniref:hypothetical protein n=1 Tax=Reyranella sp. TaxID=1929291 RepID=UPI003C7E703D
MIRSLATPGGIVWDIAPKRWGFPAPREEALHLQKAAPKDSIVLLPEQKKAA